VTGVQTCALPIYALQEGTIQGFEAEVEYEPIDQLRFTGSVGYTSWDAPNITRQTQVPEWTASAGVEYEFAANALGGTITPRLDWFYVGDVAYNANLPQYDQEAYSLVNSRITFYDEDRDFDISIGATNLFDQFYYRQKIIFQAFGLPTNLGQPAPPREWYVTVRKRF